MQLIRWQQPAAPQESNLRKLMQQQGLDPYSWSNSPNYEYSAHSHSYQKMLYCVLGTIRFTLPDERDASGQPTDIDLNPGDCLILPPGTRHGAFVGPSGVTCIEAPQ